MKAFYLLKNQRGDVLMIALMLVAISLISSLTLLRYAQTMQAGSRNPRVKSMMMALEAKVRSELLKPVNYNCPAGRDSCNLSDTIAQITALSRSIPGAHCPQGTPTCGLDVSVLSFNKAEDIGGGVIATRARVRIRYTGDDLALEDTNVVMDVPADILQPTGVYQCPSTKPKFNGFKADGTIDCIPLPPRAQSNQFVETITLDNVATNTFTLPGPTDCSSDQILSQVKWKDGGKTFSFTCSPRTDPFTVFGFTPQQAPGGDVTYVPNTD